MNASLLQQIGHCFVLSIWRETVFPSMIPWTIDKPSTLFPVPGYCCGCSFPSLHAICLRRTGFSCDPHDPPWRRHLLSLPLSRVYRLTLAMMWRCTTKAWFEKPLDLVSALWTDQLESCNSPWLSNVGDESVILPVVVPCWQNLLSPVVSSPLCIWERRPLWLPDPLLTRPCPGEVTRSYSVCWTLDTSA